MKKTVNYFTHTLQKYLASGEVEKWVFVLPNMDNPKFVLITQFVGEQPINVNEYPIDGARRMWERFTAQGAEHVRE